MSDSAAFVLTFDRVDPPLPVENRPAHIFFSFSNHSGQQTTGWVTAHLYLGSPYYDPVEGHFWNLDLADGLTATGVITITPPTAGKNLSLLLLYRDANRGILVRETAKIDIAARYTFRLHGYKPETIRGGTHDELWGSMSVIHSNGLAIESRKDGSYTASPGEEQQFIDGPNRFHIENIDVVPGSGPEDTIVLTFSLVNYDSQSQASAVEELLNEISDLGEAVGSFFVSGDSMQLANARIHQFHHALLAGCNGLVAADRITLTGHRLDEWTTTTDVHRETNAYDGPDRSPQVGCSFAFSRYQITYTVERQRQRQPNELLEIFPESHTVAPGQFAVFGTDPIHGNIDPNVTWWLDGPPEICGTITEHGGYTPPPQDSIWRTVIVVHAAHKDGRKGWAFVRVTQAGPILAPPIPTIPITPLSS